ncbi:putative Pyridine nucleotide-disulfide oxidoreductase-domain-containing protein [Seiridium cardinale]|uniref:Pyridine nucleotide-disulfide oxidoreductase-domain-containing protein n=1 Tax=Seiridium cardinale TaxID=138064 RepID=A0ABR2Y5X0_9PEZI
MGFNDVSRFSASAAYSTAAARSQDVSAIVVGGGAAGIAVLGSLLEKMDQGKIAWVDTEFKGGRINRKYREVPSNTKVALFLAYARGTKPFLEVLENTAKPNAITALEELPQDGTCSLGYAGDMLNLLSDGLVKHPRVERHEGKVMDACWNEGSTEWSLSIEDPKSGSVESRTAPLVVYCTGSSPTTVQLPTSSAASTKLLDLDVALKPSDLAATIPSEKDITVGVVGASHSAILVIMNLFKLTQKTHPHLRIRWFARSPSLKYAIYKDGWILYDNTGLKGEAARFAKEQLDGANLDTSDAGKVIRRVDCSGGVEKEKEAMTRELPECDYVVQAVGFTRDELPAMKETLEFDHGTGGFKNAKSGKELSGLFGAGIAFPERVTDPEGNVEHAVGFFKFMKFLKRVVPEWVTKTHT